MEFNVPEDQSLSYVKWHSYAREAVYAVVCFWMIAIFLAAIERFKVRKSPSDSPGLSGVLLLALGLPVVGAFGAFIFDLFLPGL